MGLLRRLGLRRQPTQPVHPSDLEILREFARRRAEHPNPLCRYGRIGFAQSDEDGITLEILRRQGIRHGTFCEIGVGDGSENNTLALLALGWSGAWIGGQSLCFDPTASSRLRFSQAWVTRENVVALVAQTLGPNPSPDVLSIDIDGNDHAILAALLEAGHRPRLVIVEYNARFPYPTEFIMDYNPSHRWAGDDYFGASLASMSQLAIQHGYRLICCNAATGANAFFVREADATLFPEVPTDPVLIHAEPFYHLPGKKGHPGSFQTLLRLIA